MQNTSRLTKTFFLLVSSGALVQSCLLLGAIFLSRLYSPGAFGEYGFYAGIASVLVVISGLRFDYINFTSGFDGNKKANFFVISLGASFLVFLIVFFLANLLAGYFPEKSGFAFWLLFFVASYSIFYQATQYLLARGQYRVFSRSRLAQVLLYIGAGVAFYKYYPDQGLSLAAILSQFILGVGVLLFLAKDLAQVSFRNMVLLWREYYRRAFVNSSISLLQSSAPFAPILFGTILFSSADVGAYFLFSQLVSSPLSVFRRSFMNFLNAEFNSPLELKRALTGKYMLILKAIIALALIVVLGVVLAIVFGRDFVGATLGGGWSEYWRLLIPMFVYYIIDSLLQPLTTLLPIWGRHGLAFRIEAARFVVIFLVLPITAWLFSVSFIIFCIFFYLVMVFFYVATAVSLYSEVR